MSDPYGYGERRRFAAERLAVSGGADYLLRRYPDLYSDDAFRAFDRAQQEAGRAVRDDDFVSRWWLQGCLTCDGDALVTHLSDDEVARIVDVLDELYYIPARIKDTVEAGVKHIPFVRRKWDVTAAQERRAWRRIIGPLITINRERCVAERVRQHVSS